MASDETSSPSSLTLTEFELELVEELRGLLGDDIAENDMAKDHSDDYTLWRFLKSRDIDPSEAAIMFRQSMEWRQSIDIDALWESKRIRKERNAGDDVLHAGICGTTKSGGPFMVEKQGKIDVSGLSKNRPVFDQFKESYAVFLERGFRAVRATGNKTRAIAIMDATGTSPTCLLHMALYKEIVGIGPPHYPDFVSRVYIVNQPWIFATFWDIMKPLVPKATAAKIRILGSNFLEKLQEDVDDANIPTFLGGSCSLVDADHDDFDKLAQACPPPE